MNKVVWVYGVDQLGYHEFNNKHPYVEFTSEFEPSNILPGTLLILDDLQSSITSGPLQKTVQDFVIRSVHHSSISIVIVLHNLFSKNLRTTVLSSKYLAFFDCPRDRSTISVLGKQAFGQHGTFLKDAYNYVVSRSNRGYLFLDFSVHQNNRFRVRDNIDIEQAQLFTPH